MRWRRRQGERQGVGDDDRGVSYVCACVRCCHMKGRGERHLFHTTFATMYV